MLKKVIVVFLVIAMVLCSSCSGDKKKETDNESKTDEFELVPETNEIKCLFGTLFVTKPSDAVINGFARVYPEIKVSKDEWVTTDDLTKDLTTLAGQMAAGDSPDVFSSFVAPIVAYYTGMFMPIQDYVDKDPDFHLDEYDEQAFKITTYNDKIYFAPLDYTTQILAYNKELFEKAGLNTDTPPKTWSEYKEMASKVITYDSTGKLTAIGVDPNNLRWDFWYISSFGKHYVEENGLRCNWNTPEFVSLLEFAKSISDSFGGYDKLEGGWWWYLFGNVCFGDLSANGLSILKDTQFDTGIARLPVPDDAESYNSAVDVDCFIGIPSEAKNPTGAWLFIKYAITEGVIEDELDIYAQKPGKYISQYIIHKPTREKLYKTLEPMVDKETLDFIKERDKLIEECNMVYYRAVYHNDITTYFNEKYKEMLNSQIAPQDLAIQVQKYSDALTKEFIESKEREGWVFEDGKDGIPPAEIQYDVE